MDAFARYRSLLQQVLTASHALRAAEWMNAIEGEFNKLKPNIAFADHSANPMDKRMGVAAVFLSLIIVLHRERQTHEQIRSLCLELARQIVTPKNAWQRWVRKWPAWLIGTSFAQIIFKVLAAKVSQRVHPDGFRVAVITDKAQTYGLGYGIDILECGICKLFQRKEMARYTSLLCEVDYITSGLAGLELVRSGTLASGHAKCDFRFRKI